MIINDNFVTHTPKRYNSAGYAEGHGDYDHISEHAVISTPEKAQSTLQNYENYFWNDFGDNQLVINLPYESFLQIYNEAIKPENAAQIYNLP